MYLSGHGEAGRQAGLRRDRWIASAPNILLLLCFPPCALTCRMNHQTKWTHASTGDPVWVSGEAEAGGAEEEEATGGQWGRRRSEVWLLGLTSRSVCCAVVRPRRGLPGGRHRLHQWRHGRRRDQEREGRARRRRAGGGRTGGSRLRSGAPVSVCLVCVCVWSALHGGLQRGPRPLHQAHGQIGQEGRGAGAQVGSAPAGSAPGGQGEEGGARGAEPGGVAEQERLPPCAEEACVWWLCVGGWVQAAAPRHPAVHAWRGEHGRPAPAERGLHPLQHRVPIPHRPHLHPHRAHPHRHEPLQGTTTCPPPHQREHGQAADDALSVLCCC